MKAFFLMATILSYLRNSLVRGKFNDSTRLLSNYVNANRDEIPSEVGKLREADMPVEMDDPYRKKKPMCILCKYDVKVDYKNVRLLSQFVSRFSGKVYGRHISGLCERQQQLVERAVHRAQSSGLMPYYHKDTSFLKDPPLFDPDNPFRSHKY